RAARRDREAGREALDRRGALAPPDRVLRAVVLELLAPLARRVERVVLDDDRAEAQHGVERDDVLRAVRQHERDGVPLAHALRPQARGRALDRLGELAVARDAAEELERGRVWELARRVGDEIH